MLFVLLQSLVLLGPQQTASSDTITSLQTWLASPVGARPSLEKLPFALAALTKEEAARVAEILWKNHLATQAGELKKEWEAKVITQGKWNLKFDYTIFGEKPKTGRSLYISLHGGGNSGKRVNDGQWENQKRLYTVKEGVYLAPRAPVDDWNMWFQTQLDGLYERLILAAIVSREVDPNRVYITGYSAGGDGIYRLGPRMADRWAAAAMMAGHPGNESPENMRNLPFALHMGEKDAAYNRNKEAMRWGEWLKKLQTEDAGGYVHQYQLHTGRPHWMNGEDKVALPWMAEFSRNTSPKKIVWSTTTTHESFYWLKRAKADGAKKLVAEIEKNEVRITVKEPHRVTVRLNDKLLDLDQEITIVRNGQEVFKGKATRTILTLWKTLQERGDVGLMYPTEVGWVDR